MATPTIFTYGPGLVSVSIPNPDPSREPTTVTVDYNTDRAKAGTLALLHADRAKAETLALLHARGPDFAALLRKIAEDGGKWSEEASALLRDVK